MRDPTSSVQAWWWRNIGVIAIGLSGSPACSPDTVDVDGPPRNGDQGDASHAWSFSAPYRPLEADNTAYPFVVEKIGGGWLMFRGGFASDATADMLETAPGSIASHVVYPSAQEELWVSESADLGSWDRPQFSFQITPGTPIASRDGQLYGAVYPKGFKTGCGSFQDGQCNVQINECSVVNVNLADGLAYYLYFTIFQNYRWYDGSLGELSTDGPTNPLEQNRQAVGLAVGTDGISWSFVGKVLGENPGLDDMGNPVYGAWAPSAVVAGDSSNAIDVYFHDAAGMQYVARLAEGIEVQSLRRLNRHDSTFRVNLNVIRVDGVLQAAYNDRDFNIRLTRFSGPEDFGSHESQLVVGPGMWPAPFQLLDDSGQLHLFFSQFGNTLIHHWLETPRQTDGPP